MNAPLNSPYFPVKNGEIFAENVALSDIAQQYGTPAYVYSANHIRQQYRDLENAVKNAMPKGRDVLICYACKASSNLAILKLLAQEGCGLETVSHGEYLRGLKAGIPASKMVSTGVGKSDAEIKLQIESGIYNINVESLPELELIQQIAQEINTPARVIFRLNPDVSGGGNEKISTGRKTDKFGLIEADVIKAYNRAAEMSHVEALGLMVHIGSQVSQVESFDAAFKQLPRIVGDLRNMGHTVSRLDIGGGFPVRYKDEDLLDLDAYAAWVRDIIAPLDVDIALEPGRYLVANAGILLTRTVFTKDNEGHHFLILDAGMNDLVRPAMYNAYHGVTPVCNLDAPLQTYDVVGPVCETGDTFTKRREIPTVSRGDLIAIDSAGAYGACMSSHYNTRPKAPEILVDGDKVAVISARETFDDLMAREHVPDWLSA